MNRRSATLPAEQPAAEPAISLDELAQLTPDTLAATQHAARERIKAAERAAARTEAVAMHTAAEQAAAPDLDQLAAAFAQDRDEIQAAEARAVASVVELLDLATRHDTRVGESVPLLRDKGLTCTYIDADGATDFATGAQPDGRALLLRDEAWVRFEPVTAAYRVLGQALATRLGPHAPAVQELRLGRGVRNLERRAPHLFPPAP